jgi:hypothetical protein
MTMTAGTVPGSGERGALRHTSDPEQKGPHCFSLVTCNLIYQPFRKSSLAQQVFEKAPHRG